MLSAATYGRRFRPPLLLLLLSALLLLAGTGSWARHVRRSHVGSQLRRQPLQGQQQQTGQQQTGPQQQQGESSQQPPSSSPSQGQRQQQQGQNEQQQQPSPSTTPRKQQQQQQQKQQNEQPSSEAGTTRVVPETEHIGGEQTSAPPSAGQQHQGQQRQQHQQTERQAQGQQRPQQQQQQSAPDKADETRITIDENEPPPAQKKLGNKKAEAPSAAPLDSPAAHLSVDQMEQVLNGPIDDLSKPRQESAAEKYRKAVQNEWVEFVRQVMVVHKKFVNLPSLPTLQKRIDIGPDDSAAARAAAARVRNRLPTQTLDDIDRSLNDEFYQSP